MDDRWTWTLPAIESPAGTMDKIQPPFFGDNRGVGYADDVPLVKLDYRYFVVSRIFERAFSTLPLQTGVGWADDFFANEGFLLNFKSNMWRLLDYGEYFAVVGVKNGKLFCDRLKNDFVTEYAVHERTGECDHLVYEEPVMITGETDICFRRTTWTPKTIKVEICLNSRPSDEMYKVITNKKNPFGFVPVVVFRRGLKMRGEPIWQPAYELIRVLQDIYNDIRLLNAYHSSPMKWIKTDAEIQFFKDTDFLQLGPDDEIGALTFQTVGDSLQNEFDMVINAICDILGIPLTSGFQIGKHSSGDAIETRLDPVTKTAKGLREIAGNGMKLMIKMLSAMIMLNYVEVDVDDPDIQPLITDMMIINGDPAEKVMETTLKFQNSIGTKVDLARIPAPDIKFFPIQKVNAMELNQLAQALEKLAVNAFITVPEGREIVLQNLDGLDIAHDLLTSDKTEDELNALVGQKQFQVAS